MWSVIGLMVLLGIVTWGSQYSLFFWIAAFTLTLFNWHIGWFAQLDEDLKIDIRKSDKPKK